MKLFGRDLEREVAVVAEIGVNHEGSVDAARRLIDTPPPRILPGWNA
jgi:sialic acid synthase SpsE